MSREIHPAQHASDAVRAIAPYVPGKPITELERELGITDIVKLASNENPLGPGPRAREAMRRALEEVWLYPDGSGHELRMALSCSLGVAPESITLGNGSNDVLVLLAEAFLTPQSEAVYSQYCFAVYPLAVQATGATARSVPALPANHPMPLGHDLETMLAAVNERTRLVFVANPNNPTGTWAPPAELERFVDSVPRDTLVVLDEAYFEYARPAGCQDGLAWLRAYPHLVVVRTFSKAHGIAGLRVGYCVSHPEVADVLNRVRQPFNVNSVALAAAAASLEDREHVAHSVALAREGLAQVSAGLKALGLEVVPSAGNFVLVRIGPAAAQVNGALLRRGVIVRPVANYGLPEHLRVTIGTRERNARFLAALREALAEARR